MSLCNENCFSNYSLNLLHNNKITSSAENRHGCCFVQYIWSSVPKTLCNRLWAQVIMPSSAYKVPIFNGDERNFELWEIKFLGLMRIRGLSQVFTNPSSSDLDKKADAFAELIQCLDDTSLSLIIRDARDDGGKALNILRSHYLSKGKPRIITLYTELTSLKLEKETITDFIIRTETLAS